MAIIGKRLLAASETGVTILPLAKKSQFNITPMYVSISPTDVATVLKVPNSHTYFAAGKYLGLIKEGETIKAQKYRKLTEQEKKVVAEFVKMQDREAVIQFELS